MESRGGEAGLPMAEEIATETCDDVRRTMVV